MQHEGQVPATDDPAVLQFLAKWGLSATPMLLQYADHGYGAAWCHVSAKHKAMMEGGKRLHGWCGFNGSLQHMPQISLLGYGIARSFWAAH